MASTGSSIQFGNPDLVFSRDAVDSELSSYVPLSKGAYYITLNASVALGYAVMAFVAIAFEGWEPNGPLNYFLVFGVVLASMIVGSIAMVRSKHWYLTAFYFYALMAAPFGVLFGPFVSEVGYFAVFVATVLTIGLTTLLGMLGLSIQKDLYHTVFGGAITAALMVFVVVSIFTIYIQVASDLFTIVLALIGIAIFSMLLVLDFNRSKFVDHNLNTAVKIGGQIWLDTLNILLRIATIYSRQGND